MKKKNTNRSKGQGIIEVTAMCTAILIPVALMFMDGLALVAAQSVNVSLTKAAARAAANAKDRSEADSACSKVSNKFHTSSMITAFEPKVVSFRQNSQDNRYFVRVESKMTVNLPVPIPGVAREIYVNAQAEEAVVGVAPKVADADDSSMTPG